MRRLAPTISLGIFSVILREITYAKALFFITALVVTFPLQASLIGTQVSVRGWSQETFSSTAYYSTCQSTAIVNASIVEFPSAANMYCSSNGKPPNFGNTAINVSYDFSGDSLTIAFNNAGTGRFASGYQNTDIFHFDSAIPVTILGASIDSSTNLGLGSSDVTFSGNELAINYGSGSSFNSTSLLRINLTTDGGGNAPTVTKNYGDAAFSCVGNPINTGTGGKYQKETDFVAAPHTQLHLTRYYNSLDNNLTSLGIGWRSEWQRALRVDTSTNSVYATQEDGKVVGFVKNASGAYTPEADVTSVLSVATNNAGAQTGWKLLREDDSTELYSTDGRLSNITTRAGLVTTLGYDANNRLTTVTGAFGHRLSFSYTGNLITQVTVPDGGSYRYSYDANKNLTAVTYPDGSTRRYRYEDIHYPHALTGIVDALGNRYATYQYDPLGRAISTEHAGGTDKTTVTYKADGSASVTDVNGNSHTTSFANVLNVVKPVAFSGTPYLQAGAAAYSYDANGFLASSTDWNGNVTAYTHDARGLKVNHEEASGTPLARTINTKWHPTFHLPTQITEPSAVAANVNRVTNFNYDDRGLLSQKTVTAQKLSQTWKYNYTDAGQLQSVTDPNGNTTSMGYDAQGGVNRITNALGQATTFINDADGRPVSITDPNGLVTTLTYTLRGQVASRTVGQEVTQYGYDLEGNLKRVTSPDGSVLYYAYDAAHRLTRITDPLGNHIDYTLDASGNVTAENVYNASGTLKRSQRHAYDAVNRLIQDTGAYAKEILSFDRDSNGNLTGITDPNNLQTSNQFDALNRLAKRIDPNGGATNVAYYPDDHVAAVTDARNVQTRYVYDGLGNATQVISPDSGTTTRSFDAVGNVLTSTDARGKKTLYRYDKLNRLVQQTFADKSKITFTYDQGSNGIGRLTTMIDSSGNTNWAYDAYGHLLQKKQKIGKVTLTTTYAYDAETGQLQSMTLPSNKTLHYSYDANGRPLAITADATPVVSQVSYDPFGGVTGWVQGANSVLLHGRTYDLDGRMTDIRFPNNAASGQQEAFGFSYDVGGRITGIDNNTLQPQTIGYDALDAIASYQAGVLDQNYSYDLNGNRTALTANAVSTSYTIAGNSNRLLKSITGKAAAKQTLDTAGNLTSDGQRKFAYNAQGLLTSATAKGKTTRYSFNGLGERVKKSNGAGTTLFTQNGDGNITGEYNAKGVALEETIYLGNLPVGVLTKGTLYYVNPDQLGTPRTITDNAGAQVWRWDHDAFGNGLPTTTGKFAYNLRFPGQYYDAETGLHHNNARDYNPATGRYIQSDPIGLMAGNNTYTYVGGNPVNLSDPSGQCPFCIVALFALEAWNVYDTANDIADTAKVFNNECSTDDDKLEAVGLLALGLIDPTPGNLGKKGLKKVAKGVGPAKRVSNQTVLGNFPDYVKLSDELGARRFEIPIDVWNKMSPAERWGANQKFLDRMISKGDEVILSNPASSAQRGTSFFREIEYMKSQGYRISDDGLRMLPRN